jgi:hypothetical protein
MKKFKVEVERTYVYEIELDEKILDEKFLKDFKENFYNFNNLKEHAEHIAAHRASFTADFIEGYGVPLVNGKVPCSYQDKLENVEKGVNIKIISEDDPNEMWINSREI